MTSTPVDEFGIQLTRLGLVNCYLVRESDGYTLIDANLRNSEQDILATAAEIPVRRILLTHPHIDHVGSVDGLMTILGAATPAAEVLAAARAVPLLRTPPDLSLRPNEEGPIRGRCPGIQTPVTRTIASGDRVGSLLTIATPGHIHGHLSFLDERTGTLYAGDALFGLGHLGVTGWAPWWFPMNAWSSRVQARQTAIELLTHPIQRFATGHGPVRTGGHSALRQAINAAIL